MISPIPYFYDPINRNTIVVKPKQPLIIWVNTIYKDTSAEAVSEGTVYLIKEKDSNEAIEKWLKKNFDDIFKNELNNWHTDEKDWPQKRTFKQFKEWFEFEIHSMILDIEDFQINKH